MPSSAIFDASVVVRWVVDDPLTPAAIEASETWAPVAPTLLGSEFANALRSQAKAGRYEADWCLAQITRLTKLIDLRDEREHWPLALKLGLERDHAVYDCVYVAMAVSLALPLITADSRLTNKFSDLPGLDLRPLR
ncbi:MULTISPECIES: type II toxin-antitoxin system VapC family toxin [unclassified Brevundimonas]|uniref:type II toxin-antitoxin system VapC family toxin n=1 Tax=unclassified Brevundimonas TaxID=2622653 RepID=UPI0025794779|nr:MULTISPECIES: type II toxin-antitoxin system VapC family toxin [unclassified Brevundimonas]